MLSQAQNKKYWREWGRVARHCKQFRKPLPNRHALHIQACGGLDKGHACFTNPEFDNFIALCAAIYADANLNPQLRQIQQPRTRMLHKIINDLPPLLAVVLKHPDDRSTQDKLAAAESYILRILDQKYHTQACHDLTDPQLKNLIVDITRCINKRRLPLHLDWPALEAAAATLLNSITHAHAA